MEYIGIKLSGIVADKVRFGTILAVIMQFCWPLALVQLYALWTHTVLTHQSSKSLRQLILHFKATLQATGSSLILATAIRLLITYILMSLMAIDLLGPIFNPYQPSRGFTYAAGQCLVDIALVPVRMVLARIQASLLPSDERPISPLNEALVGDGKCGGSRAVGTKEACTSLGWDG